MGNLSNQEKVEPSGVKLASTPREGYRRGFAKIYITGKDCFNGDKMGLS